MARSDDERPCRVCGGDTEPAPPEVQPAGKREQRRCASPDCAGRQWWVQVKQ